MYTLLPYAATDKSHLFLRKAHPLPHTLITMKLTDVFRALFRQNNNEPLPHYPEEVSVAEVNTLEVHTAHLTPDTKEVLVIVTLDPEAFRLARSVSEPLRMTCGDARPVTWVPVTSPTPPVLDPNLGWIIPLTPETQQELQATAEDATEIELETTNVALVVKPGN